MSATTTFTGVPSITQGWLRNPGFDLNFIAGIAAGALLAGAVVASNPGLFGLILLPYLWLLGYPHLLSTFTRTAFDATSFREHRRLMTWLPAGIFALVLATYFAGGVWMLTAAYLYAQWYHFTRQSYGIYRAYGRKATEGTALNDRLTVWLVYLVPVWGILYRSWEQPEKFLQSDIRVIPVPEILVQCVAASSIGLLVWWSWQRFTAWRAGRLPVAQTLYLISHFALFITSYVVIRDINHGWLVMSIWHSAQYIAFVWMFNAGRFRQGVDSRHPLLSRISQPDRKLVYYVACFGISTVLFLSLNTALKSVNLSLFPLMLLVYMAINFHHYTLDAIIWRGRKKPARAS